MKKFLPAILANLSAALSEILLMASAAWLIASAALQPPLSALSVGITLVRTAGISRAALRYADRFLTHKIIFKTLDELREKIFLHAVSKLPLKSGLTGEGELLHRLTITADKAKDFLPRVVLPISTAALVTLILTFFLSQTIGLSALILSTSMEFPPPDDSTYREKLLDFNDGRDELKIFGITPAVNKLNRAAVNFGEENFKSTSREINFDTFIKIFNAACTCAILYKISLNVDRIELTVWALILISVTQLFNGQWSIISDQGLGVSGQLKVESCKSSSAIKFNDVTFSYNDAQIIFKNFNLEVKRGEKLLITGESGSGKTTLLYLMTKLFTPDSGTVEVNGTVAAATSTNYIFSESIRANFKIFHENISNEEILAALKICRLENFDINAPIGEDAANLSGGERLRLQIALALAKNPDVLILDEPTAGLNHEIAENLIAAIIDDSNKNNRTLIIITHDLKLTKTENLFDNRISVI